MKENLIERYKRTRERTIEFCAPMKTEDYIPQPVDFVSPPKWHLAHTTWFFEEMILKKFDKDYKEFNEDCNFLFNSYYNTIGERTVRAERGVITRPTVDEVYSYRKHVDQHLIEYLSNDPDPAVLELVELGLNHEEQHQELLITDFKYTLGLNPINPVFKEGGSLVDDKASDNQWIRIEEGVYEIGHDGNGFCFDNELGQHKVFLHAFEIASEPVTNREFIEFIDAGGYEQFAHWLDEGWAWVNNNRIKHPLYWEKTGDNWGHFTLEGFKELDPDAILSHVSFYEANAFAQWKGMRLPSEFEWEVASSQLNWGKRWEWTNSAYLPYPQFQIAEGAVGEYNGKFMINQMVLRGGSVATSPGHSRKTYRNFFHPHFQWQFSGIRLAKWI